MRILLHACCGPCAIECVHILKNDGHEVALFWYNPNIEPKDEHDKRYDSLRKFADLSGTPLIAHSEYGVEDFVGNVISLHADDCGICYTTRLYATANATLSGGFDAFSTTLLISPYQKHDVIRSLGESVAQMTSTNFYYHDFRPSFREGQRKAREMGLYMQKYCGCGRDN